MSKHNWKRREAIFHEALELADTEREAFLASACVDDTAGLAEIKRLIEAFESNTEFLEEPGFDAGLLVLGRTTDIGLENSEIGSYKVGKKIGEGGMGEVYDALDTRLNRRVALKFLAESFTDDNLAKRQLIREAQAVAMLDHANICSIYGIEQIDKHHFIAMQYIEGLTLAEVIKKGQADAGQIGSIIRQIVLAAAFAHSHGVIHRDLKPANIMIRQDGQVKVLDFGLAKTIKPHSRTGAGMENSSLMSQNGLIIGTVSYMSPEQLRGERLDYQSDIFSIGIILYELISGRNPFTRNSQAETISSILSEDPATLRDIKTDPTGNLAAIVQKCLAKDKVNRFQSTAEILVELDEPRSSDHSVMRPTRRTPLIVAGFLLFLTLAFIFAMFFLRTPVPTVHSIAIKPIANESNDPGNAYLSDGLTASLGARLGGISQLRVTPPTIASAYKGRETDPETAGRELNVEMVLSGKIVSRENSLFLQATLVKTDNGEHLWDREFKIDGADLVTSQETIAILTLSQLRVTQTADELELFGKKETKVPEAYDEYFRGLSYLNNRNRENIDQAITHFGKAVKADPSYAQAWAGLADSYVVKSLPAYGSLTPRDAMVNARAAANRAIELNEDLCEAHNSLGMIKLRYDWNWAEAENSFAKAIKLNPEYAPAHYWYSYALLIKGDFQTAMSEALKARDLDPLSLNSEINVSRVYYYERQNGMAIEALSKILETAPSNKNAGYLLGLTYLQSGRYNDAVNVFEKFYDNDRLYFGAQLGYAYGRVNRKRDAMRIMGDLDEFTRKGVIIPAQEKAIVHLGMGENDKAFELFRALVR